MLTRFVFVPCLLLVFTSCEGVFMDSQKANTPQNNLDLLWQVIDERYCFFEEKQIDWDSIYVAYSAILRSNAGSNPSSVYLFNLLSDMLLELQDGHVSICNQKETRAYDEWYSRYSNNCDENLIETQYLNRQTRYLDNGTSFTMLSDSIVYIRCLSFVEKLNRSELDEVLSSFASCRGIIIDVRNNGGGLVSDAYALASRFTHQITHTGYVRYKTGKGHADFSEYFSRHIEPEGTKPFLGKVVVLTNRRVYSAANLFVSIMKCLPQVRLMGDNTGGGGGVPISTELYNGWMVELSTNPVFDTNKKSIESGIEPHDNVSLQAETPGGHRKTDNIIESAKKWILQNDAPVQAL